MSDTIELKITTITEDKSARPKWQGLHTLEYEKQVFLKNNIFIGSPIIFCGFRTRANRLADQNYYHLSIYNIQARGAYYNTYDIKVDKKNSWEWAEIPE